MLLKDVGVHEIHQPWREEMLTLSFATEWITSHDFVRAIQCRMNRKVGRLENFLQIRAELDVPGELWRRRSLSTLVSGYIFCMTLPSKSVKPKDEMVPGTSHADVLECKGCVFLQCLTDASEHWLSHSCKQEAGAALPQSFYLFWHLGSEYSTAQFTK